MKIREHLAPHRIRPVRIALENQRDQLLAFAVDPDRQLVGLPQAPWTEGNTRFTH